MQKLSTFHRTFWKSLTSLTYYQDVVNANFGFSFKYFWIFSLSLGLMLTLSILLTTLPVLTKFNQQFLTRAGALYPQDLVITIKNGQMSTNVTEPLHIPFPFELITQTPPAISDQKQLYLITFDTYAKADDYKNSQSLILVTREDMVVSDQTGYRAFPLKDLGEVSLDKKAYSLILEKLMPALKLLVPLFIVTIIVVFIFIIPISRLFSLIFLTLLLLPATKLMHLPISYKKLYQLGLHSLTLPSLIQILTLSFGLFIPIPFFTSILYLLYMLVILAHLKEKSALTVTPPQLQPQIPMQK